ncbi:hypothetical protein CKAH01_18018 [Colletotrichum kahawae]|uniref:Uncharacterized protein n=1 Tax=Colletotrichum kahawae TaxID=34407 RepID=A0AAD9YAH4_COLKA|nr:hypothetical protein CKAH01_18018 [Colletotrichum kahawae]
MAYCQVTPTSANLVSILANVLGEVVHWTSYLGSLDEGGATEWSGMRSSLDRAMSDLDKLSFLARRLVSAASRKIPVVQMIQDTPDFENLKCPIDRAVLFVVACMVLVDDDVGSQVTTQEEQSELYILVNHHSRRGDDSPDLEPHLWIPALTGPYIWDDIASDPQPPPRGAKDWIVCRQDIFV